MKLIHLTSFEIAASAGIIALIADFTWLIHDIILNGISITYGIVATGLGIGIIVTGQAWIKHHKRVVKIRKQRRKDHQLLLKCKKELHIK